MQDQIQATVDGLLDLLKNLKHLGNVKDDLEKAIAKLEATNKDHDKISVILTEKKGLLDKARAEAIAKHDEQMFEKTKALRQLTSQVAQKQADLNDLTAKVAERRTEHDQVLASFESLRKRLT